MAHPVGTRVWLANDRNDEKDYKLASGDRIEPGRVVGDRTEPGRRLSFAVPGGTLVLRDGGETFHVVRVESPPATVGGSSLAA